MSVKNQKPQVFTRKRRNGSLQAEFALGSFHHQLASHAGGVVYGAHVAIQAFHRAMLRYSNVERWELFAAPFDFERAGREIKALGRGKTRIKNINVHKFNELSTGLEGNRLTAWHSIHADQTPFLLRHLFARTLYPVTLTHHTISYASMLHRWFLPLLLADAYPCDAVVCTSTAARQAVSNLLAYVKEEFDRAYGTKLEFGGRLEVIPLGVDTEIFRPRNKAKLRERLGLPSDAFLIMWLGRVSATDKADLLPLLSVFRQLVRDHPGRRLRLLICGTPQEHYADIVRHYAQALGLGRRVVIRKEIEPDARHLFLAAADIFVSPTDNIQETFGQTPVEAMACGTPQVVSDWNGYRDTVRHGQTGFLVPTRWMKSDEDLRGLNAITHDSGFQHLALAESVVVDLKAFQDYLQALIVNDSLREEMGRCARARALETFSWETVIGRYEELWLELARMARRLKLREARENARMSYLHPSFTNLFAHYATGLISDQARLHLTATGQRVLEGEEGLPSFQELSEVLQTDLLCEALELLGRQRRSASLSRLVKTLGRKGDYLSDHTRRHLLWLLKYGFAELAEEGKI